LIFPALKYFRMVFLILFGLDDAELEMEIFFPGDFPYDLRHPVDVGLAARRPRGPDQNRDHRPRSRTGSSA
jgi:hypothetical protein